MNFFSDFSRGRAACTIHGLVLNQARKRRFESGGAVGFKDRTAFAKKICSRHH